VNVHDIKLNLRPQTHFQVAVTETSEATLVARGMTALYESVAKTLGPRRTGPIGCLWWNDPAAVANVFVVLERNEIPCDEARARLGAHPGGALIVAFADCLPGGVG
jgi:hypothetical protein